MRLLYEDQIHWTRIVACGVFEDLKGKDVYMERLLWNYEVFEQALTPYYKDGAEKLGFLIEEHTLLTAKVFEELKAGGDLESVLPKWYDNADEIAVLMDALNPKFWQLKETKLLWRMYLDATLEGAIAQFKGDWVQEVASYDALHHHALKMADFMSRGILLQFPRVKFPTDKVFVAYPADTP